jgi:double-stranded uracil-DNA glycosylase
VTKSKLRTRPALPSSSSRFSRPASPALPARPALPALPALKDHLPARPRILFVGINPGIRSATIGHHFAGYSNRFWKLLFESKLVPEAIRAEQDVRLPEFGYGITNLVARPTPGIDTLKPAEYQAGVRILERKVRRAQPRIVAFLGVTLFRAIFKCPASSRVAVGLQRRKFEGARVFVLPNPSGRNANFTYAEMLAAFRALRRAARRA